MVEMEEQIKQVNETEENPFKHIKTVVYVLIVLGFILYKLHIVGAPCDTCGTIFNTRSYEIKTGFVSTGTYSFCDNCADNKRKEIEKENEYRSPFTY